MSHAVGIDKDAFKIVSRAAASSRMSKQAAASMLIVTADKAMANERALRVRLADALAAAGRHDEAFSVLREVTA